MAGMALNNASSITLQTSGVNVSECKKDDFLVLNLTADYTFLHSVCSFGENYKLVDVIVLNISGFHHF